MKNLEQDIESIENKFAKVLAVCFCLAMLTLTGFGQSSVGTGGVSGSYAVYTITLYSLPGGAPGSTGFTTNILQGTTVTNTTIVTNTPIYNQAVGGFVTNYTTNSYVSTNVPVIAIPLQQFLGLQYGPGPNTVTDALFTSSIQLAPSLDGTTACTNNNITMLCTGGTNQSFSVCTNLNNLLTDGYGYWLVVSNYWSVTNPAESFVPTLKWARKVGSK